MKGECSYIILSAQSNCLLQTVIRNEYITVQSIYRFIMYVKDRKHTILTSVCPREVLMTFTVTSDSLLTISNHSGS